MNSAKHSVLPKFSGGRAQPELSAFRSSTESLSEANWFDMPSSNNCEYRIEKGFKNEAKIKLRGVHE
jgi:hypothetical protein